MHRKYPLKINRPSIVNNFMDAINENVKLQVCENWTNDGKFLKVNMNEKLKNYILFQHLKMLQD